MKKGSFKMALLVGALLQAGLTAAPVPSAAPRTTAQEGAKMKAESKTAAESPFYCNLAALDAEQRKQHREATQKLREAVREVRELQDGYAFRFAAETERI